MKLYQPSKILIEEDVYHYPYVKKILNNLTGVEYQIVSNFNWKEHFQTNEASQVLTQAKKILYLKKFLGTPMKLCPAFSKEMVCCNYYTLNFVENCPFECSYCILQAFHNQPMMVFHVNVEEILEKILNIVKRHPNKIFRIGTGEHSDSLATDHIFQLNPYLVEEFGKLNNVLLELKTKSANIDNLLHLEHNGKTIVGWSINSEFINLNEEHLTASIQSRIDAAQKLVHQGYHVAFHFDPLIYHENWEQGYCTTIDKIFSSIEEKYLAWISVGSLRYIPKLKSIAEARFKKTPIFSQEFVQSPDGKQKYFKPIRDKLVQSVVAYIRKKSNTVPLYLCMENKRMWQDSIGEVPMSAAELEAKILKKLNHKIIEKIA